MSPDSIDPGEVRFFSGSSHPTLAGDIAAHLNLPLDKTHISRFSNDDLYIQLSASVRSRKVFIVQSLFAPVNDHLMELLMMLDIARSAGAIEVHAVIPYFSFSRSDKKDAPRISITARLVADLLQTAGATHVMTMMLHSPQVHGFFSVPTDPLTSRPIFGHYFREQNLSRMIVVSPDMGHAHSAARFARDLGLPVIAGNKERVSDTEVRISGIIQAQLQGCNRALIYDDEIATGTSILEVCRYLVSLGVEEIDVACTHGVFSHNALQRLVDVPEIRQIVTTDTVAIPVEHRPAKLKVLSVAQVFADAIKANYFHQSIGPLFAFGEDKN
jgi:ribose-phosphate pyrophosphokinase